MDPILYSLEVGHAPAELAEPVVATVEAEPVREAA
jgi:hypothetical protein